MGWLFFHFWSAAVIATLAVLRGRSALGWALRSLFFTAPIALLLLLSRPALAPDGRRLRSR